MKRIMRNLCVVVLIVSAACSGISVHTDYDRNIDFTVYKTYRWLPQKDRPRKRGIINDPFVQKRIRDAVEEKLASKGMMEAGLGKADLLIAFHMGARNKVDVTHYGYRYGRWGLFRGHAVDVHRYKEGTLIVDFIDARTKELVWRGWATSVLHGRENIGDDIDASVSELFERYPPEGK
jgi:hypothetical protein